MVSTTDRVDHYTSQKVRDQLDQELKATIAKYRHADRDQIDQRLAELDQEWNVERMIELEAPLMIGLGAGMGLLHNRKWFGLSAAAASMVVIHNTLGWYPLLPIFQRLGFRSQNDIEQERSSLRVLRKDHEAYTQHQGDHDAS